MAVLYRKYRPTRLADVVGQEQVTKVLSNALSSKKLAHAYLFIGPRGTGKTSVARIFAHAVNGFDYQVEDSYLDIIEIDAASNTGVDNIRDLREKAIIAPTKGKYKVYIIDEVHMLSKSAANALLKTLEEPPEHVIFIMATTDAHKVPITISSRTQVHQFRLADDSTMLGHLRVVADQEKIKITDDALKIIVRRGGGSFRDSLSLLDQVASLAADRETIEAELLERSLGLPSGQAVQKLLEVYTTRDGSAIRDQLKVLLESGVKPEVLAGELIEEIIRTPRAEFLPLLARLPEVGQPWPEAKLVLALLTSHSGAPVQGLSTIPAPAAQNPPSSAPERPPEAASGISTPKVGTSKVKTPKAILAVPSASPEAAITAGPSVTESSSDTKPPVATATNPEPTAATTVFDWDSFTARAHEANLAVYNQLLKCRPECQGNILHLYPTNTFAKNILGRTGNMQILRQCLPGYDIQLHEVSEPTIPNEDSTVSQISAIMGNIQEVDGDSPF